MQNILIAALSVLTVVAALSRNRLRVGIRPWSAETISYLKELIGQPEAARTARWIARALWSAPDVPRAKSQQQVVPRQTNDERVPVLGGLVEISLQTWTTWAVCWKVVQNLIYAVAALLEKRPYTKARVQLLVCLLLLGVIVTVRYA